MIKHISIIIVAAIVLLGLAAYSTLERVPYNEIHLIQRFGQTRSVIDGRVDSGLHFKWPWPIESSMVYDARVFTFESATTEGKTQDNKALLLTLSCSWEISKDKPLQFYKSVRDVDVATRRIRSQLSGAMSDSIGHHNMNQFVNADSKMLKLDDIENEIYLLIAQQCLDDYGVQIRSVRIKLLGLPGPVTESVFESIAGAQMEEVNRYKGEGEAMATAIKHRAEQAQEQIFAMARRKAGEIRSKGELAATKSYEIMSKEPWLALYLRELEAIEASLQSRTTLFLDGTYLQGIEYLRSGPPKINATGEEQ